MEIIKTIDSKEGMKCILNGIQSFNANKFLWACNKSNFSVEDIDSMTNYVCSYQEKLEVEFDRLQRFGKNFTNRYSTEDNMFFDTQLAILRRMKSSTKCVRDIYMKFCPKEKKYTTRMRRLYNVQRNLYVTSYLVSSTYSNDFWGYDTHDSRLRALFEAMKKFFDSLYDCMNYALDIIRDELEASKDVEYTNYLYEKLVSELMETLDLTCTMFPSLDENVLSGNPLYEGEKEYSDNRMNINANYHKCTKAQVFQYKLYRLMQERDFKNLLPCERNLFYNDLEKARQLRPIVKAFNRLLPTEYKKHKLSADYIAMFFIWAGITNIHKGVEYFKNLYGANHDALPVPKYKQISKRYKAINQGIKSCEKTIVEMYHEFRDKISALNTIPNENSNRMMSV